MAAAHKEVEAEKCHSTHWVTSSRRPRGDEVSQSQGRGLASSPQPWARHHQSHWHPLTFLCICFNVPLPPSIPPPPQEDLFTSMAYASPSCACLSLSPSTLCCGCSASMKCFISNYGESFLFINSLRGRMLNIKRPTYKSRSTGCHQIQTKKKGFFFKYRDIVDMSSLYWLCSDSSTVKWCEHNESHLCSALLDKEQHNKPASFKSSRPNYVQVKRADAWAARVYADEGLINAEYIIRGGSELKWFTPRWRNKA